MLVLAGLRSKLKYKLTLECWRIEHLLSFYLLLVSTVHLGHLKSSFRNLETLQINLDVNGGDSGFGFSRAIMHKILQ